MSRLRVQLAAQIRPFSGQADPVSSTGQALLLRSTFLPFHPGGGASPPAGGVRKLAVDMYTEGSNPEAIGRGEGEAGNCPFPGQKSPVSWELMRVLVAQQAGRRRPRPVRVLSLDEMWTNVVGKGLEANRNEGLHSVLRDKLNRMHWRTKVTASA